MKRSIKTLCLVAAPVAFLACRGAVDSVEVPGGSNDGQGGASTFVSVSASGSTPLAPGTDISPLQKWVRLTLDAGQNVEGAPFRTGVPFPMGAVRSLRALRLETADDSSEIAAQFDSLAEWPDGSIKSALVQLVTDTGTGPMEYRLAYGRGVRHSAPTSSVSVTQGATLVINTGTLKLELDGNGMLETVHRDLDGDGAFQPAEQVLHDGSIFAVNALDGFTYTSALTNNATVVVEEDGPVRAVVRASGSLTRAGGAQLIRYMVRYYAYLGSDKIDVELTVIDDRLEQDVHDVYNGRPELALALSSYGLRVHSSVAGSGAADYRFGGENGAAHGGTVTGEHFLLQEGTFTFDNGQDLGHTFQYSGAGSGQRAPGWMALDGTSRHFGLLVKDFWQQFPGELNIDGTELTVALHPERAIHGGADTTPTVQGAGGTLVYERPNAFYFEREGGAKTYQMRFLFPDTAPSTADLHSENALFQSHDHLLMAEPEWYTSSGVFGDLDLGTSPDASHGFDAHMMQGVYVPSMAEDRLATNFGWRDFGDRLRAGWNDVDNGVRIPGYYNDTHVGSNNFFRMYLRTGDLRWFSLAETSTRHFMDIDVSHGPRQGYWYTGGQPQPAGEVHAIGHGMRDHTSRNLHRGHAHVSGLSDYYLLTGDKRAREVLAEIAGWWEVVTPYMFPLPFQFSDDYREATRDYGWPLYAMNECNRVFGDPVYHQSTTAHAAEYMLQWWQTRRERIGFDADTGTISNLPQGKFNDAAQGTGFWTMTNMDNSGGYPNANGCSPWMAGSLISHLIQFREQDALFAAQGVGSTVDPGLFQEMLFQTINYLVRNGYDAAQQWWVYSETIRTYTGGDEHILFALAYLDRLFEQELAAGNIANPQWYGTQPMWSGILGAAHAELMQRPALANTQSYGWYGYEILFPLDFFKIMNVGY